MIDSYGLVRQAVNCTKYNEKGSKLLYIETLDGSF